MKIGNLTNKYTAWVATAMLLMIGFSEAFAASSFMQRGVKFVPQLLQRTKETRAKISSSLFWLCATSAVGSLIISDIDTASRYKYKTNESVMYGETRCHELLYGTSDALLTTSVYSLPLAYVIRFPLTAATILGVKYGSKKYEIYAAKQYKDHKLKQEEPGL